MLPRAAVHQTYGHAQATMRRNTASPIVALRIAPYAVKLMESHQIGGKQVHDANIVATMLTYGIPCLLTHNAKDFERFNGVIKVEGIG